MLVLNESTQFFIQFITLFAISTDLQQLHIKIIEICEMVFCAM